MKDEVSRPRVAPVDIQEVQALGIVDREADITIINEDLFKEVAAAARLRKKDFRNADKVPIAYDGQSFQLHGASTWTSPLLGVHYAHQSM